MTYTQMREAGLCPHCGKENPTPDKSMCPACRERDKEMRKNNKAYRLRIGMCVICGKNKAEPNRVTCYECLGREKDRRENMSEMQKLMQRSYSRNWKRTASEKRRAAGLCPRCGKRPSDDGMCSYCRARQAVYRERRREEQGIIARPERIAYGLCYICGAELKGGEKICSSCYERRIQTIPALLSVKDNSYWKSLEAQAYAVRHA